MRKFGFRTTRALGLDPERRTRGPGSMSVSRFSVSMRALFGPFGNPRNMILSMTQSDENFFSPALEGRMLDEDNLPL